MTLCLSRICSYVMSGVQTFVPERHTDTINATLKQEISKEALTLHLGTVLPGSYSYGGGSVSKSVW